MSRRSLYRLSGFSGIGSAILAIAALVGFIAVVGSDTISQAALSGAFYFPALAALGSIVLLTVALVGLYLHQEEQLGTLGLPAFLIALIGGLLATGAQWTYVFVVPRFAPIAPAAVDEGSGSVVVGFVLSYALLALGWLLFGIALLKVRSFPRGAVILVIVGAVISFLPLPSRTLVLALGVAYLGFLLLAPSPPIGSDRAS